MAGDISNVTTNLSNLVVERQLSTGTIIGSPAITGGAATFTTVGATSGISVGGGVQINKASVGTFTVAAIAAANATSSTTTAAISGLSTVDLIMVGPTSSGLSAGLSLNAFSSGSGIATLVFNNGSASTVTQATGTYRFAYFRANG